MSVYYNEVDHFCAAWLHELMKAGEIPGGEIDTRSITDVRSEDLRGFSQCHFFAGIGGWAYALRLAGWPDDREVWTGSCPCQPFSEAGARLGVADERHLWPAWFDNIRERRPASVYGEQVASNGGLAWLDGVFSDLEGEDYAVAAADLPAPSVGAYHRRQRLWFVGELADNHKRRCAGLGASRLHGRRTASSGDEPAAGDADRKLWYDAVGRGPFSDCDWMPCLDGKARPVEPGTFPLAHGVPARLGRLRGYGNAIVPQVAALFITASARHL